MQASPLRKDLQKYLTSHNLANKFTKQLSYFLNDPMHPSLNTEKIKIKNQEAYSFRIDRKYRVIFFYYSDDTIEIVDINNHYH
jgi:Txe/YoeB family toxin of Txe-Axe toxin-antitoxin module